MDFSGRNLLSYAPALSPQIIVIYHLHLAAAIPAVWRIALIPKRMVFRQYQPVQRAVTRPGAIIQHRDITKIRQIRAHLALVTRSGIGYSHIGVIDISQPTIAHVNLLVLARFRVSYRYVP